jgi:hypothetical protein
LKDTPFEGAYRDNTEYREYADECVGWAKTAKSDKEREIFLQMAHTWREAAARAETSQARSADARKQFSGAGVR